MDVSDILTNFFLGGRGRGSPSHQEQGGCWFSIENPRRGGVSLGERGGGACLREFWGGGGG